MPALRDVRPSTVENYRSFTLNYLIPYFGKLPVSSITGATLDGFMTAKLDVAGSTRFEGCGLSRGSLRTGFSAFR